VPGQNSFGDDLRIALRKAHLFDVVSVACMTNADNSNAQDQNWYPAAFGPYDDEDAKLTTGLVIAVGATDRMGERVAGAGKGYAWWSRVGPHI
jgi:hypothetical protein